MAVAAAVAAVRRLRLRRRHRRRSRQQEGSARRCVARHMLRHGFVVLLHRFTNFAIHDRASSHHVSQHCIVH